MDPQGAPSINQLDNVRPAAPTFIPTGGAGKSPSAPAGGEPVFLETAVHVTDSFTPDTSAAPVPTPETEIPKPDAPPSPLKQIRTFQGDIAEALKEQNASLYAIQQAEKKKAEAKAVLAPNLNATPSFRPAQPAPRTAAPLPPPGPKPVAPKPLPPKVEAPARRPEVPRETVSPEEARAKHVERERLLLLLVGTMVLIGLGGYGSWYAYNLYIEKISAPVILAPENHFIATDSSLKVDTRALNRDTLLAAIADEKNNRNFSGVEQIELHTGASSSAPMLTTQNFLTILQTQAPKPLVRALDPHFMLGVIGGEPSHPFILIKLADFENAFPGMLSWEKTLATDIWPLIQTSATESATPTDWADVTIKNKDARILRDENGNTIMLYSFFNNNMLIITDNETTLRLLITDLTTQALVR